MNDLPDSDLDISWINEQHRIQNIQNNYCKETVDEIIVYSLYINKDSYIEKITCKKQPVVNNLISRDSVLGIIQKNKVSSSKKYKLLDVLVYHVDLEPQHIQSFSKIVDLNDHSKSFFKVLPIVDEISIPPSIFIFHSLNSVFFMYKEVENNTNTHSHTIKSILKKSSTTNNVKHKHTKKVRISNENIEHPFIEHRPHKPKKTRKNILSVSK